MKEFDKWLKDKAGIGWYTGAEEGWIAALKFAESKIMTSNSDGTVIEAIIKELYED